MGYRNTTVPTFPFKSRPCQMFLVNAQPVSCLLARPRAYKAITLYDAADVI